MMEKWKKVKNEVSEQEDDVSIRVWPKVITPKSKHRLIIQSAKMKPNKRMALLMVIAGYEIKQVSEVIHKSRQTIYNWLMEIKHSI